MMDLVRNWWMMAIRGALAVLFGTSILLWPNRTLAVVVLLFALYALLDGLWGLAAASRASRQLLDTSPILLEGMVSVLVGVIALVSPLIPRQMIHLIAGWAVAIGILEIVSTLALSSASAGYWLLGTGGITSLSLGLLILLLPYADASTIAYALGVYALLFGVLVFVAACRFRQEHLGMRSRAVRA